MESRERVSVYREEFVIPDSAIDRNGHVNNVAYVQWMQDIAVRHHRDAGCEPAMREAGGTWVVRSHRVEYLGPAVAGDRVQIVTWVANFRRVRSLRKYTFVKPDDGTLLVRGETDWVFVDIRSGRPRAIPESIVEALPPLPDDTEP